MDDRGYEFERGLSERQEFWVSLVIFVGLFVVPLVGIALGAWCWFYCG